MNITVLAATGATGQELVEQALSRGHSVTALVRDPSRIPPRDRLRVVAVDVHDPQSIANAVTPDTVVLSGLGVAKGDKGTLTAGARGLVAAQPKRIIWLGAYGSGASAHAAGAVTRNLLKLMGDELIDKVDSDTTVLRAGGTVFHAGPLSKGPISPTRRTVTLDEAPKRFFPATVSRATVAAAMLDEAERPHYEATTAIPLEK